MFSLIILTALGIAAVAGVVATFVVTLRDGYHRVPAKRA
ncbi:hypothetical protein BH11ACT2_BH11ACT2_11910 [soil metagenome]